MYKIYVTRVTKGLQEPLNLIQMRDFGGVNLANWPTLIGSNLVIQPPQVTYNECSNDPNSHLEMTKWYG